MSLQINISVLVETVNSFIISFAGLRSEISASNVYWLTMHLGRLEVVMCHAMSGGPIFKAVNQRTDKIRNHVHWIDTTKL